MLNSKKNKTVAVGGDGLGSFDRLPADITLLILNRVDFKTLCQNLILSKSFSSITYRIESLTITLCTTGNETKAREIDLRDILCSNKEEIPAIVQQSCMKSLKFCKSLEKFRHLKSICVEFDSPTMTPHYSPFMWKLICQSSGSMVKNVVSVLPQSILKINSDNSESNEKLGFLSFDQLRHFAEWNALLFTLIKCHDLLESITIFDSKRSHTDEDRVFVLRDEQLVKWRNLLLSKDFCDRDTASYYCQVIRVNNRLLPKTGYVMENVLFIVMGLRVGWYEPELDDVVTWHCTDDEIELFREAVPGFINTGKMFVLVEDLI